MLNSEEFAQGDLGKKIFESWYQSKGALHPPRPVGFRPHCGEVSLKIPWIEGSSQFSSIRLMAQKSQGQPPFGMNYLSPQLVSFLAGFRTNHQHYDLPISSMGKPDVWPTNMLVGGKGIQNKTTFFGRQVKATNFSPTIQPDETTQPPNHQAELNFMPRHVVVMAISWGMMWFH